MSTKDIAKMIDHSLLHPSMTDADLKSGCELAARYDVATVCIKPYAVPDAVKWLRGSYVEVCAVAGFPHGNSHTEIIIAEAVKSCKEGATEIDMVCNTGKVLGEDWGYVFSQVKAVNDAVTGEGAILKVIFENDFLQDSHIIKLCEICTKAKVAFVKTSTGYGFVKQDNDMYSYSGATVPQLKLMRRHCGPDVQIKAAGGIRSLKDVLLVRSLGVSRVGATATAAILDEARNLIETGKSVSADLTGCCIY